MNNISVVIPVYNCAEYINEAIDSVINQTLRPKEIIIVNDGSTDGLLNKIEPYGNGIIVINQKNKGLAEARNVGIKNSTGEIIAFLDADDIWYSHKLDLQVKLLNSDVGFVFCNKEVFYDNLPGVIEYRNYSRQSCLNPIESLLTDFFASPSTVIIKRALIEKVGFFDPDLKKGQDSDLWIRIAPFTKFDFVEEPLVRYRIRENSLSNNILLEEAIEIFHRPILKNKKLILKELEMDEKSFQKKIHESKKKLKTIYSK